MEVIQPQNNSENSNTTSERDPRRAGKIVGGLLVVIAGLLLLGREVNMPIPGWVFTWQMLLISIGVFTGFKHGFRNFFWLVLIAVGVLFIIRDYVPGFQYKNFIWPLVLIAIGLYIVFKPKRTRCNDQYVKDYYKGKNAGEKEVTGEDFLEINSVFGGVDRVIVSKNFRGGEINTVFGGAEINLSQADIGEKATLQLNAVFGGIRLVIPPHWTLQSELTAFMGGVEDKRPVSKDDSNAHQKVLILKGQAVFGGIEVQSY